MTPTRAARSIALVMVLGIALAACANQGQAPAQPSGANETPLANQSYPAPGTSTPLATSAAQQTPLAQATAANPTAAAGATATVAAPTAPPGVAGLLGPEWTVAYSGDLNLDGRADAIGWAPMSGVTKGPTFSQAQYANYVGPASQVVIVHAAADGKPQVQFAGTIFSLTAAGTTLTSFDPARRPAAFMFQVNPRGVPSLLELLQVNASGEPYAQAIGIRWNTAAQAYRITGAAGK